MLTNLYLRNFALIESADVEFSGNFNVLTGETGAGKSILIDAVGLVIGGRASTAYIRSGSDSCQITACFDVSGNHEALQVLEAADIEPDGNSVIIDRDINRTGRSRARINGRPVTLALLRDLGRNLIQIYGQHEHTLFLDEDYQRGIVDDWGRDSIEPLLAEIRRILSEISRRRRELASIGSDDAAIARELDILQFQVDEIEEASLRVNEDADLEQESRLLRNIERIYQVIGEIEGITEPLGDRPALSDTVGDAYRSLKNVLEFDSRLANLFELLQNIHYNVMELPAEVYSYRSDLDFDPERLNQIEERLDLINTLKRKYGDSVSDIHQFAERASARIYLLQNSAERRRTLNGEITELTGSYLRTAGQLSEERGRCGAELCVRLAAGMKGLGMEHAKLGFSVEFDPALQSSEGSDRVDFEFSANLGEPLKSLREVISGGELSRLMLVLKTLMVNDRSRISIIFDEVDVGIGGRVATAVAGRIRDLSRDRQVLCVTHLPVIAAASQHHFGISKRIAGGRTVTEIRPLTDSDRLAEVIRMLGGKPGDTETLELARRLLQA